jgi:hypothetical protein
MSLLLRLLVCGAFVACAGIATADEPSAPRSKAKADPRKVEVVFDDGSTVKMTLLQDHVEITSRYGKFKIPIAEVVRIEFGLRYPEGVENRVNKAIAGLGDRNFRKRESASAELLDLAEYAYPALREAANHSDAEVVKRAEELVKKIEENAGERLAIPWHDVIHTIEFPIPGRIELSHFKASTPYFGEVQVALAEIRSLRCLGGSTRQTLTLDAAKYAALDTTVWKETRIEVTKETTLEIDATGEVDVWPLGPGYKYGPDGYRVPQVALGGGLGGVQANGNPPPGALIGRIGAKGAVFLVGAHYKGSPKESGKLFVRVMQSPWNNESTGSFEVKLKSSGPVGRESLGRDDSNTKSAPPPREPKPGPGR